MVREVSSPTNEGLIIRGDEKSVHRELVRMGDSHSEGMKPRRLSSWHEVLLIAFYGSLGLVWLFAMIQFLEGGGG